MLKVSIIIPVYNVEPYIERCIRSVMSQTYPQIECIVVDDCSPDRSIAICERLIEEYSGTISFLILHHEHNRGISAARNTGTTAATGDYIYYLDSDDEITPNCIELMVDEVVKHPDVQLVVANRKANIEYDFGIAPCFREASNYHDENVWLIYQSFRQTESMPVTAWNKLISKRFVVEHNLCFKEGIIFEDQLWSFYLSKVVSRVATIHTVTYNYFVRSDNITHGTPYHERCKMIVTLLNIILPQIERPLADLQTMFYLKLFIAWYQGIPRRSYMHTLHLFVRALIHNQYYLFAAATYLFFRFNLSLKLRRYEKQYIHWLMRLYTRAENRAKKRYPALQYIVD